MRSVGIILSFITSSMALFEGDECIMPETGQNGKCIEVTQCEYVRKLLNSNRRPQHCGFNSRLPLVCCPPNEEIKRLGEISTKECLRYHDAKYQVFGIILGNYARPREFPHMAAIGYGDGKNILWLCGGSLISEGFVLTAAHCTRSRSFGEAKWVRLGDLDLKNTTEDANPIDLKILEIFTHPNYKPPSHYNDIALLKLDQNLISSVFYKPACLYTENYLPRDKYEATGWGKTDVFGESSSHLMKVDLQIINYDKCFERYSDISPKKLPRGIVNEFQICAGDSTGKDTCMGDSGGPLHYRVEKNNITVKHFVVVGITSFGKGCGAENSIAVYTRVSAYVPWIESIVWPQN